MKANRWNNDYLDFICGFDLSNWCRKPCNDAIFIKCGICVSLDGMVVCRYIQSLVFITYSKRTFSDTMRGGVIIFYVHPYSNVTVIPTGYYVSGWGNISVIRPASVCVILRYWMEDKEKLTAHPLCNIRLYDLRREHI